MNVMCTSLSLAFVLLGEACLYVGLTATAAEPSVRRAIITNSIGIQLLEIPAGEYVMGAEEDQEEMIKSFPDFPYRTLLPKYDDGGAELLKGEIPRHKTKITSPFLMSRCEVTLGQFMKFINETKHKIDNERFEAAPTSDNSGCTGVDEQGHFAFSRRFRPWKPEGWIPNENHPVTFVSWNDANAFCDWLSVKEKAIYRLPTEAEWEYACRAGTSARFHCGNDPESLVRFGNVMDSTAKRTVDDSILLGLAFMKKIKQGEFLAGSDGHAWLAPVGLFEANGFGLCDMHGNVSEWCLDRYDPEYYKTSPAGDPPGPNEGEDRVIRGGACLTPPILMRCALRDSNTPTHARWDLGFRIVRLR